MESTLTKGESTSAKQYEGIKRELDKFGATSEGDDFVSVFWMD